VDSRELRDNGAISAPGKRAAAVAAACALLIFAPAARAADARVDGISDQSLPAWDGAFASSSLAALLARRLAGSPPAQIRFARYVVQWDAIAEPSGGPNPHGDYRERFEAWLVDVHALGLTPVVALTSYTTAPPPAAGAYTPMLQALLDRALALGEPLAYVEPWNEPNGQGRAAAATAAGLANAANALCSALGSCEVIAGDFQDTAGAPAYERSYEAALTFAPGAWGVHPYVAVATHDARTLSGIEAALPRRGSGTGAAAGAPLWLTEVGGYYCRRGHVLGAARQAADVAYLLDALARATPIAPAHVFYYGVLYADGREAPCTGVGGEDTELYGPGDQPRPAALLVFGQAAAQPAPLFGPGPGADPMEAPGGGV
jgi:hypothetical protein